ncbi:MAG: hypothetical protein U1E01_10200, partial [Methylicorpusculum sp.]|nr:hypothetical protein [Methylicorpusculum sp.]
MNFSNLNGFALTQDSNNKALTPIELPDWPYVFGGPAAEGAIRSVPEDFSVYENLSFLPSGDGEHVFLQIEKRSENTE